ncbi:MAG: DUF2339 domain-containing protein [Gaiellaceae bacterium]
MKPWHAVLGFVGVIVAGVVSPVLGVVALVGLVLLIVLGVRGSPAAPPAPSPHVHSRLAAFERKLAALEVELSELKRLAGVAPEAPPARAPEPEPASILTPPPPPPARTPRPVRAPSRPRFQLPEVSAADLLGAQALAWAGGVVTVLGVVFFFVLAVNRGWISPELRLGFGGFASILAFSAGFWVRRRYGHLHSALAAAGAGIAGGYATLVAAAALYEFLSREWALVAAGAIAAVGVATALVWSAQLVAHLGLVGAMLVPLMVVVEDERFSFVGTAFVGIVFAGTAAVAVSRRWRELLLVGAGVSLPQVAGLVGQAETGAWDVVGLAAGFWLVYLAASTAWQLRVGAGRLDSLAATLSLAAAVLAGGAAVVLFAGEAGPVSREGAALLAVSAVHGALGAAFFLRRGLRDFSTLQWATALAVAAVAAGELLSGYALAVAWAGEAAILAWLAERTRERRFALGGVAYLGLAVGYSLAWEAPASELFVSNRHPAEGAWSLLAVAVAAAAVGRLARRPFAVPSGEGAVAHALNRAVAVLRSAPEAYFWLAGTVLLYATSLSMLELSEWIRYGDVATRFERGHVAVTGLWAVLALVLVASGMRLRGRLHLQVGGFVLLALAVVKTVAYDATTLGPSRWPLAFLAVAGASLLAGFEYQRLGRVRTLRPESALAQLASLGLALGAVLELADGTWHRIDVQGGALILLAAVYTVFAAPVFRARRDFSTLLWGTAAAVAAAAAPQLLDGLYLTLAWAAGASVLAWLAPALREFRFQIASATLLALALAYALGSEAPPRDFVVESFHPAIGVPSVAFVVAAALVFALLATQRAYRSWVLLGTGVLALYGASLTILEVAEAVSQASVRTDFQRGHTAVSAFWSLVGVMLLYLGLTRRGALRLAGFALFGVSLAKLFLYDLTFLSSLSRALSFLAVGALLMLGGFFYQRLSEQVGGRQAPGPKAA